MSHPCQNDRLAAVHPKTLMARFAQLARPSQRLGPAAGATILLPCRSVRSGGRTAELFLSSGTRTQEVAVDRLKNTCNCAGAVSVRSIRKYRCSLQFLRRRRRVVRPPNGPAIRSSRPCPQSTNRVAVAVRPGQSARISMESPSRLCRTPCTEIGRRDRVNVTSITMQFQADAASLRLAVI